MTFFRVKLVESEATVKTLKRSAVHVTPFCIGISPSRTGMSPLSAAAVSVATSVFDFNTGPEEHIEEILTEAKKDLKRLKKKGKLKKTTEHV